MACATSRSGFHCRVAVGPAANERLLEGVTERQFHSTICGSAPLASRTRIATSLYRRAAAPTTGTADYSQGRRVGWLAHRPAPLSLGTTATLGTTPALPIAQTTRPSRVSMQAR